MLPPPPLNLSSYYILDTILEEQSLSLLPEKKPGCLRRFWNFFGMGKPRSSNGQHPYSV